MIITNTILKILLLIKFNKVWRRHKRQKDQPSIRVSMFSSLIMTFILR
jgi:hypothetical protein